MTAVKGKKVIVKHPSSHGKMIKEEFKSLYQVEKNVPVSTVRSNYSLNVFPFTSMNVGDSFLIPANDVHAKNPNGIHYAAHQYAKIKTGFSITTRLQLNKDRRVWRIK